MLAFLLIVGVSYYLVATSLIGLVGDSLFSDRMRQDHAAADKLAAELGPLYAERDMEKAQQLLESAGWLIQVWPRGIINGRGWNQSVPHTSPSPREMITARVINSA